MRILVAHNHYLQRGGEDVVVEAEMNLLRQHGHEVSLYSRDSSETTGLSGAAMAAAAIWSRETVTDIRRRASDFRPDLIHVHNTFPLISPSIYWVASELRIPVIQTLHNFRLVCPQAMFLRDGKVCETCLGHFPWAAVMYRCYHRSRGQTAVLSGMLGLHRVLGTYANRVAAYIALTRFSRDRFIRGGLPAKRIFVKPNFVEIAPQQGDHAGKVLFVGRLSREKGIDCLIEAADVSKVASIDVIGRGPMEERIIAHGKFRLRGWLPAEEVYLAMSAAPYLVVPSIWYETFGLIIIEAFACGTPVIASRHGAMQELVEDGKTGLLFSPGDPHSLADRIDWAMAHPGELKEMGMRARREYEQKYCASVNYNLLMDIYRAAARTDW